MTVAINTVEVGAPVGWISGGWNLFTKAWVKLIVSLIVFYVAFFILSFIPLVGQVVGIVGLPMMMVAAMFAMREIERTGDFNFQNLMDGVKAKLMPVLIICAVNFVLVLLMVGVNIAIVGGAMALGGANNAVEDGFVASMLLAVGVSVIFGFLFGIANMFSLPLIALTDMSAVDALKASVFASLKNILAMIVYGIFLTIMFFVGLIPLGLGLLIAVPVSIGSTYYATRALFPAAAQG